MVSKHKNPVTITTKKTLLLLFLFFLFESIRAEDVCSPTFCSPIGPEVRFPFHLIDRQPSSCGFPGFDLSCNERRQTILKLPSSRSFIVNHISYITQVLYVDPDFCGPEKLSGIKLISTPFEDSGLVSYTFFNCTSENAEITFPTGPTVASFPCLGSVNHSVFAMQTSQVSFSEIPQSCKEITTILLPTSGYYGDIDKELTLTWFKPYCTSCEALGKPCNNGSTTCIESSSKDGISWAAKSALSIGIPGLVLLLLVLLHCCIYGKGRRYNQNQSQSIELLPTAVSHQPPKTTGLDRPTVESYPKTVWGESYELPKDNGLCAICLSDYKTKDEVRTIPECNHYFHVVCVDEWLKLNATCPVCRKPPQSSSMVTPITYNHAMIES